MAGPGPVRAQHPSQTTLLLVQARAGGTTGTGYSYDTDPEPLAVVGEDLQRVDIVRRARPGPKFGHPGRPVIVFEGDGAMQMNGLAELITIKRYWREWSDPRLIVAVLHNDDLNQVTWEMRAMEGAPKFTESQTLPTRAS